MMPASEREGEFLQDRAAGLDVHLFFLRLAGIRDRDGPEEVIPGDDALIRDGREIQQQAIHENLTIGGLGLYRQGAEPGPRDRKRRRLGTGDVHRERLFQKDGVVANRKDMMALRQREDALLDREDAAPVQDFDLVRRPRGELHVARRDFGEGHASKRARYLAPGDRKSTRLNSNHGYISYAVFCLKKKKKNNKTTNTTTNTSYTIHKLKY